MAGHLTVGCNGETAKTKLTPELQAEIAKNVSRSMTNDRACRLAGIHRYRYSTTGSGSTRSRSPANIQTF